jgi:hypothetical protein
VRTYDKVKALEILATYLKLSPIGDQTVDIHVREGEPPPLPNQELSPKIVCLIELATKRKKEQERLSGESQAEGLPLRPSF